MTTSRLRQAIEGPGLPLSHLTVLDNDPFRLDTAAPHRNGRWLGDAVAEFSPDPGKKAHLRGMHYLLSTGARTRPDKNSPYLNDDPAWDWLGKALSAARWLGYVSWEKVIDQRNAEPVIRRWQPPHHEARIVAGVDPLLLAGLTAGRLLPVPFVRTGPGELGAAGFRGTQSFHLAAFGEKSSLEPVLAPLCAEYEADLFLPSGEISDTLLYRMAASARDDGRPMVLLAFSDCDPAGWQMPISIARKLQAFRYSMAGLPDIQVFRVALTVQQVRKFGLPHSPLKETEQRADEWRAATGVSQTEVDALAALRPDLLEQVARAAFAQFFDATLKQRGDAAYQGWLDQARRMLEEQAGEQIAAFRALAEEKLAILTRAAGDINDAASELRQLPLPDIEVPEAADLGPPALRPLYDSREDFVTAMKRCCGTRATAAGWSATGTGRCGGGSHDHLPAGPGQPRGPLPPLRPAAVSSRHAPPA